MAEPATKFMTVDEFLAWNDGSDARYELIDGQIVMMNPPLRPHRVIVSRLVSALGRRLRPPCETEVEAGVRLPWTRRNFYNADLAVSCTPFSREPWIPDPILIAEVLSASTRDFDRSTKLPAYRRLPTVQHILLVSPEEIAIEHYARSGPFWRLEDLRAGDTLRLEALRIEIPVDEIYAGLPLGAGDAEAAED